MASKLCFLVPLSPPDVWPRLGQEHYLHYEHFSDCEPILTLSVPRGLSGLLFILKRCDPVTLSESYALDKGAILLATQKAD